ncbi:MAG: DUF3768 domain-containing protein [Erythrobacter sp.]
MTKAKAKSIRELNDAFRTTGIGGMIELTDGVACEPPETVEAIRKAVRDHCEFTKDNDPHGEHDFGAFEVDHLRLFWKIDYYNPTMDGGSEDPTDPQVTTRVLTIMLREEY